MNDPYIGRFAPSPTGPLHMGSLVCALASFLDARHNRGKWLVRIEDIDPAREPAGAADRILRTLERHGLLWDDEVMYQSRQSAAYDAALQFLFERGLLYRCTCTRARLEQTGHHYDGHCLRHPPPDDADASVRFQLESARKALGKTETTPEDRIHGVIKWDGQLNDDFVVRRKYHLYAYHLAVTVDDAAQGVTHVVRGSDLLSFTRQQTILLQTLGAEVPVYCHIPLILDEHGQKLSKQNHAPALNDEQPVSNLMAALACLGMPPHPDLKRASVIDVLSWGVANWPQAGVFLKPK